MLLRGIVKVCLIEPENRYPAAQTKIKQISSSLKQLGYNIVELDCNSALLEHLRKDKPDVVFNLASIYAWEKTNLIPAVLEIGGYPYTGSGILSLSLARNYTRLFPLLLNSGIKVPDFNLLTVGSPIPERVPYPLILFRDGCAEGKRANHRGDLVWTLRTLPVGEEVILLHHTDGPRASLYLLDGAPFLGFRGQPYLEIAQKSISILEARGLVRCDFIRSEDPTLEWIEIAPDPLEDQLISSAAQMGWDPGRVLEAVVLHSGRDHIPGRIQ